MFWVGASVQNSWVSTGSQDHRGHGTGLCGTAVGKGSVTCDRAYCVVVRPCLVPHAAVNSDLFARRPFSGTVVDFLVLAT